MESDSGLWGWVEFGYSEESEGEGLCLRQGNTGHGAALKSEP